MIDDGQLTSSVDARRPNPGVILSLAENLIQNLLLFLTEIHFSVVGPSGVIVMSSSLVPHDNEEDNEKI